MITHRKKVAAEFSRLAFLAVIGYGVLLSELLGGGPETRRLSLAVGTALLFLAAAHLYRLSAMMEAGGD